MGFVVAEKVDRLAAPSLRLRLPFCQRTDSARHRLHARDLRGRSEGPPPALGQVVPRGRGDHPAARRGDGRGEPSREGRHEVVHGFKMWLFINVLCLALCFFFVVCFLVHDHDGTYDKRWSPGNVWMSGYRDICPFRTDLFSPRVSPRDVRNLGVASSPSPPLPFFSFAGTTESNLNKGSGG